MAKIHLATDGQKLIKVNCPKIASGDKNADRLYVECCPSWDGFTKTAAFYRTEDEVYYAVLDVNNECIIPWEVLQTEGLLYLGIFGVKGDIRRTSEVISYKIDKGAIVDDLKPSDPTPDIYDQIIAQYNAHVNNKNNPHGLTAPQIGAAPTGFGLGVTSVRAEDCNTALKNGWYYYNASSLNKPSTFNSTSAPFFVIARNTTHIIQRYYNTSSGEVLQRYTTDAGATWVEEWVNPPMVLGQTYRTTERWKGYPVYVVTVNMEALPNNDQKQVQVIDTNESGRVIDAWGIENSSGQKLPTMRFGSDWNKRVEIPFSGRTVTVATNFDGSAFKETIVTAKFVKY